MKKDTDKIDIEFLDHVAIRVVDMEVSAAWYQKVLDLTLYQLPEWGPYPVFLLSGKSGIALFPADISASKYNPSTKNVCIDHFAFHVSRDNFEKAKEKYTRLNLDFHTQDHIYFDSIYTKDPDGHTVELTTLKVPASQFYQ